MSQQKQISIFTLVVLFAFFSLPVIALGQSCTGLCQKQISCSGGGTTSISGRVYAPNGVDPLPNVLVFIPNGTVAAFPDGISCPVPGTPPSGSPLVGATTRFDGSFTLSNVPVGSDVPLVIQAGRWRRQLTVSTTTACEDTKFDARMPRNRSEGDIPRIAVATGSADAVECVLRKVGIDNAEFTNPIAPGRIHLYTGSGAKGALIDLNTPSQSTLMQDPEALKKYDVLMLPCQANPFPQSSTQLQNFLNYANSGGRVYASHFSYMWLYDNAPLDKVVDWQPQQPYPDTLAATINTSFAGGKTLSDWLQYIGATTTPSKATLNTVRRDFNHVIAPTQSWMTLDDGINTTMQMTFNTPVGAANQCGRVLFNEYHVENPVPGVEGRAFPDECDPGPMTNQEKLLEYSLFDLTSDGGPPTLAPATTDFGSQTVGFPTAVKTISWTNNSIFPASITSASATGDFVVVGNDCRGVAQGAACSIQVAFKPSMLGPANGTLSVVSPSTTLQAALTGTGVQALQASTSALGFPNTDVGASATLSLTLKNNAAGPVNPELGVTGDYAIGGDCGALLAAGGVCTVQVTFTPRATGSRTGAVTSAGQPVSLTGNGVDFKISAAPTSGGVIAGHGLSFGLNLTPIAGFSNTVSLSCSTTAPASTCNPVKGSMTLSAASTMGVAITTTAHYTVVGFEGAGRGMLVWLACGSALGLFLAGRRMRAALPLLVVLLVCVSATGCSSKSPEVNTSYTPPGAYTYTVTATDGFVTRSATYDLKVTVR